MLNEGVEHRRVEVRAASFLHDREALVEREGLLVGAARAEGVEHVGDRDDATDERDVFALEAERIAGAVPAFVVRERDGAGHVENVATSRLPGCGRRLRRGGGAFFLRRASRT